MFEMAVNTAAIYIFFFTMMTPREASIKRKFMF